MIIEANGNLLGAPVEGLVNTVNTVGVMGKGLALQFKKAFPAMFKAYADAVKRGTVELGRMHVWPTGTLDGPQYIINFPTKGHWRAKSRMTDIEAGLQDLVRVVQELDIKSVAVPPLGCGNGGLPWSEVEPRIRAAFEPLEDVDVYLYPPAGAPAAREMPVALQKPGITPGRATLIGMIDRYVRQSLHSPSLIETQKLMYFLQVLGEPLRLNYVAHRYGPYADNLRHALQSVEGYYIQGFGDGSAKVLDADPLELKEGAAEEASLLLGSNPRTIRRIEAVLDLVEGFESAYGLELLATVHWVAAAMPENSQVPDVHAKVESWSQRKAGMFSQDHVAVALEALQEHSFL